jgi:hypothetical protein
MQCKKSSHPVQWLADIFPDGSVRQSLASQEDEQRFERWARGSCIARRDRELIAVPDALDSTCRSLFAVFVADLRKRHPR